MPSPALLLFVNIDNSHGDPIDMRVHTHSASQAVSQPVWWCEHLGNMCYPKLTTWVGLGYSSAHLSSWVDLCSPLPHVNRNMRGLCAFLGSDSSFELYLYTIRYAAARCFGSLCNVMPSLGLWCLLIIRY
jgi:hypothetical protein